MCLAGLQTKCALFANYLRVYSRLRCTIGFGARFFGALSAVATSAFAQHVLPRSNLTGDLIDASGV